MNAVTYSRLVGTLFALIALVHAYRLVANFPIDIGGFSVPHAASWLGVVLAGALAIAGLRARE